MRIFFSHAGRDKPLVREIASLLPESITMWIDEKDLPVGSNIKNSLETVISDESDLVLFFISQESTSSPWVKKELEWALKKEESIDRIFIFPIVLDQEAWNNIEPIEFKDRKKLDLQDYTTESIKSLSKKIERAIFDWMIMSLQYPPKIPKSTFDFAIKTEISFGHLSTIRKFSGDNQAPNKIIGVQLENKEVVEKNKFSLGIPFIDLKIVNEGMDIQIEDISISFNPYHEKGNNIFDDAEAISLTSLEYENKAPIGNTIRLKTNHSEKFLIKDEIIIEQILKRGIKDISIKDSIGNLYKADDERIDEVNRYIKNYFELKNLSELYKNF